MTGAPINKRKYSFPKAKKLQASLNLGKRPLDELFPKEGFRQVWTKHDPFFEERWIFARTLCTYNISNAWLKCYEIITHFNLVPEAPEGDFIHFDNAAFPGAFVLATHHLVHTMRPRWCVGDASKAGAPRYIWRASSLLGAAEIQKPLEDKYKLFENYPDHWLMGEGCNGDVLSEEVQRHFREVLPGTVDLYTSDLGFDVSDDYNTQEAQHYRANVGQILSGLLTLKPGGAMIVKQYTTLEAPGIALLFMLSQFFEEFHVCKPRTSRAYNGETYLVGKGFAPERFTTEGSLDEHPYIRAMFDVIAGRHKPTVPMLDASAITKRYLTRIMKFNEMMTLSLIHI